MKALGGRGILRKTGGRLGAVEESRLTLSSEGVETKLLERDRAFRDGLEDPA